MFLLINLRIAGILIFLLAIVYPIYPRRFGWRKQLDNVSLLVRNVFVVHVGIILLLLWLQGVLFTFFPHVLLERSAAAVALLIGLVAFWFFRFLAQLFIFDRRNWQGDRLNTTVHVVFTILWAYFALVCVWALVDQFRIGGQ